MPSVHCCATSEKPSDRSASSHSTEYIDFDPSTSTRTRTQSHNTVQDASVRIATYASSGVLGYLSAIDLLLCHRKRATQRWTSQSTRVRSLLSISRFSSSSAQCNLCPLALTTRSPSLPCPAALLTTPNEGMSLTLLRSSSLGDLTCLFQGADTWTLVKMR